MPSWGHKNFFPSLWFCVVWLYVLHRSACVCCPVSPLFFFTSGKEARACQCMWLWTRQGRNVNLETTVWWWWPPLLDDAGCCCCERRGDGRGKQGGDKQCQRPLQGTTCRVVVFVLNFLKMPFSRNAHVLTPTASTFLSPVILLGSVRRVWL